MRICLYTSYFPPMMGGVDLQASLLAAGRPFREGWCLNLADARWVLNLLAAQFLWAKKDATVT